MALPAGYLTNPFIWLAGIAALIGVFAASSYLRYSTRLSAHINANCPDLWNEIRPQSARSGVYYNRRSAYSLEYIVMWNVGKRLYPADPNFKRLLGASRWSCAVFLVAFAAAIFLFGYATRTS
jgi:hypothetical protein